MSNEQATEQEGQTQQTNSKDSGEEGYQSQPDTAGTPETRTPGRSVLTWV